MIEKILENTKKNFESDFKPEFFPKIDENNIYVKSIKEKVEKQETSEEEEQDNQKFIDKLSKKLLKYWFEIDDHEGYSDIILKFQNKWWEKLKIKDCIDLVLIGEYRDDTKYNKEEDNYDSFTSLTNELIILKEKRPDLKIASIINILNLKTDFSIGDIEYRENIWVNDIVTILTLNKKFNFNNLNNCLSNFKNNKINDFISLIQKNPQIHLNWINVLWFNFWLNLEQAITTYNKITTTNPNFDFHWLIALQQLWLPLDNAVEKVNSITKDEPDFYFYWMKKIKYLYWLSLDQAVTYTKKYKYTRIMEITMTKWYFWELDDINELNKIIEADPNFDFWFLYELVNIRDNWLKFEDALNEIKILTKYNPKFSYNSYLSSWCSLEDAVSILDINPLFSFDSYYQISDLWVNEESFIETTLKILNEIPKVSDFSDFVILSRLWLDIDKSLKIIKANPDLSDFSSFVILNNFWLNISESQEIIRKIINKDPNFDFSVLQYLKGFELTDENLNSLFAILKINPNFNFIWLFAYKEDLPDTSLQEVLEMVKKYPNIDLIHFFGNTYQTKIWYNFYEKNYNEKIWTSLAKYIDKNDRKIRIWTKEMTIWYNFIMSGIYNLAYQKDATKAPEDRWKIIDEYQTLITEFITSNKETETSRANTDVFFARVDDNKNPWDDDHKALTRYRKPQLDLYKNLWYTTFDVVDDENLDVQALYKKIENWIHNPENKDKKLLIDIWAHGGWDGSTSFKGENLEKWWFKKLFKIDDQRITINLASCVSWEKLSKKPYKTDKIGKLYMNSGMQESTNESIRHFQEAYKTWLDWKLNWDFDWDWDVSRAEAKIYEMMNYADSVTPFFWQRSENERVRLGYNESLLGEEVKNKV